MATHEVQTLREGVGRIKSRFASAYNNLERPCSADVYGRVSEISKFLEEIGQDSCYSVPVELSSDEQQKLRTMQEKMSQLEAILENLQQELTQRQQARETRRQESFSRLMLARQILHKEREAWAHDLAQARARLYPEQETTSEIKRLEELYNQAQESWKLVNQQLEKRR